MSEVTQLVISELGGWGAALLVLGIALWRIWLSRILSKELEEVEGRLTRLRSELDGANARLSTLTEHSTYLDRVQFEHEFGIYKEIWATLVSLRMATMRLRPIFDTADQSVPEATRRHSRLHEFGRTYETFRDFVEKNRPFYASEVYGALEQVMEKCYEESVDYEHSDRMSDEYWAQAKVNRDEVARAIDKTCDVIRKRISDVKVVAPG